MIVETLTEEKSQEKQDEIHTYRVELARLSGYTIEVASGIPGVPDGTEGIRGKIGNPPVDDPRPEAVTWLWAIPTETTDGTFEIPDLPSADLTGVEEQDYVRRDRPPEWNGIEGGTFGTQFAKNDFDTGEPEEI